MRYQNAFTIFMFWKWPRAYIIDLRDVLLDADAQADLSLRWAHIHFAGFGMSRLK